MYSVDRRIIVGSASNIAEGVGLDKHNGWLVVGTDKFGGCGLDSICNWN